MSTVTLAPHLERALDAMSKDLGIETGSLVNQAVFAWLRINGYVAPSVPVAVQPLPPPMTSSPTPAPVEAPPPSPVAPVAAAPEPVDAPPAPMSVAAPEPVPPVDDEALVATPPQAVAAVEPAPVEPPPAEEPAPEQLWARLDAIEADLTTLARPWPEWVEPEAAAEEEDDADRSAEEADDAEAAPERASADAVPAFISDLAGDEDDRTSDLPQNFDAPAAPSLVNLDAELPADDHIPSRRALDPVGFEDTRMSSGALFASEDDKTILPGSMTALSMEEEPPADSTVVLKASPFVLYLEREGAAPVKVDVERFIIGRGPQCDLIIDSPRVSREHLAITRSGLRFVATDLNSSNGTWLGEERIAERELETGDVLHLGNEPVTFVLRAE